MAVKKTSYKKSPAKYSRRRSSGRRRWFLPYPAAIFVLLCVGVLLIGWTYRAIANTEISATIEAQPLTSPAVIQSPKNATIFTDSTLTVSGNCPAGSYVDLYDNDVLAGAELCTAFDTFGISTDLFIGANNLQARVFNFTNQEGPKSDSLTVYYSPPAAANGSVPTFASQHFVMDIDQDFQYSGYFAGKTVQLRLTAGGGTPPYVIDVDWGDGDPELVRNQDGPFTINHVYSQPGPYLNSYTIQVTSHDANGQSRQMQFFVIINTDPAAVASTKSTKSPTSGSAAASGVGSVFSTLDNNDKWLLVAWPSYLVVVLMSLSYILGERQELLVLRHRQTRRR